MEMVWRSELLMRNIINMTLKNKITIEKKINEMRQVTLDDPKFDSKKSLDCLVFSFICSTLHVYLMQIAKLTRNPMGSSYRGWSFWYLT